LTSPPNSEGTSEPEHLAVAAPVTVAEPVAVAGPAKSRLVPLTFGIAAGTLAADQLTKIWALHALADGHRVDLLGPYLGLRLLRNPGAALGLGYGYTWVLTILVAAVTVVLIRVIRRIGSLGWAWALGLLLGGAIGNLLDRLFRAPGFAHGHVIDFIAYWNWFIGNVADIAIVVAAGLIILLSLRGIGLDGSRSVG
jgi:signal peptidase II